jgi:hypothetical protein
LGISVTVEEKEAEETLRRADGAVLVLSVSSVAALLEERMLGDEAEAERESDDADLTNTLCGRLNFVR